MKKKLISIITAVTVFAGSAIADEGMWLRTHPKADI